MLNNINSVGHRSLSFGHSQPVKRKESEFNLANGVQTDAEAVSVLGAATVGGVGGVKFVKSAFAEKAGKYIVTFGDDVARHSKQVGKVALKLGKGSYNVLKETGEILVKVVLSLFLKFVK